MNCWNAPIAKFSLCELIQSYSQLAEDQTDCDNARLITALDHVQDFKDNREAKQLFFVLKVGFEINVTLFFCQSVIYCCFADSY